MSDDLHAAIMNLPSKWTPDDGDELAYKRGHRDARHASAELAAYATVANDSCVVNRYSSGICQRGTPGCGVGHVTLLPASPEPAAMSDRDNFEKWLLDEQGLDGTRDDSRNCYSEFPCHLAHKSWQAARAPLEAEIEALKHDIDQYVKISTDQATENTALAAELERLREDAERYRLLRRGQGWSVVDGIGNTLRAETLDSAIDAARAGK